MLVTTPEIEKLETAVFDKYDSFLSMGVWPPGEKFNPHRWLNNFKVEEKEAALYLLNGFTFYNMDMAMALLKSSIVDLSKNLPNNLNISERRLEWRSFLSDTVFVPVRSETGNITDSGSVLAGPLRKELGIGEQKILTVQQLYDSSQQSQLRQKKRVVFFDDFVGSGDQFSEMWTSPIFINDKVQPAVKDKCLELKLSVHYCGMIATEYGLKRIIKNCPEVSLHFSHVLQKAASPLDPSSKVWPEHLKVSGPNFVLEATRRLGIAESNIRGHHDLGLAFAFSFTMPDATLPLFNHKSSNWYPLMERS